MYCMEVFITSSFSLLSWTTIRCGAILQIPEVFHYCELECSTFFCISFRRFIESTLANSLDDIWGGLVTCLFSISQHACVKQDGEVLCSRRWRCAILVKSQLWALGNGGWKMEARFGAIIKLIDNWVRKLVGTFSIVEWVAEMSGTS